MHEIITLQFGQQANYVGSHYWNTQESYFTYAGQEQSPVDHDRSFRPGVGPDGQETYTPRTLIYDLKGAFGTLRRENALYEMERQELGTQTGEWNGPAIPLRLPPIAPNPYQTALEEGTAPPRLTSDTVRFWSDYNHLFYHPRSIVQLNEYELNSSLMPFERYNTGEELFADLDREHDLLDRDLRPFLEECDRLQGIQVLSGVDDAWGGFSARYLERVSDDLGKGCRWVFGLQGGKRGSRERHLQEVANTAQSVYALNTPASMHIPLTSVPPTLPSYVSYGAVSQWETSAVQAALMESVTLPVRLRRADSAHATFDNLETALSNDGNRRLAAAGLSAGNPDDLTVHVEAQRDSRMSDEHTNGITNGNREAEEAKSDLQFFPNISARISGGRTPRRRPHVFSAISSLRGQWKSEEDIEESNAEARNRFAVGPKTSIYQSQLLFPTLSSYPQIFRFEGRPESFAIKASLSTSTVVADRIRSLEGVARRIVGIEEREALCDGLMTMAEEYEAGWSEDEDEDDD